MSTLFAINSDIPAGTAVLQAGDLVPVYEIASGRTKSLTGAQIAGGAGGAPVSVTAGATTLVVTQALHAGRTVVLNNTAPIAITLPQATGSGSRYRFVVAAAATGTASTIKVANATDNMSGGLAIVSTSATDIKALAFGATATDDTISLNGTTQAGTVGTMIDIEDAKTGLFAVRMTGVATGSYATPFSATV